MNHVAGSLPQLVENLVKNWEVEASFKPQLSDWRTIDHANYSFAINGGPPQTAEHMLKVGTYNAIIAPNEYYSPQHSDFATSHKTFKRMMPTFAWEVLEVYSGPPKVSFRWRHWGTMKNDYVGFNDKGEKVTAKAHGGPIDIQGVTVAQVDDKVRLQSVHTWFDPLEMFRQIAPNGVVNKEIVSKRVDSGAVPEPTSFNDGLKIAKDFESEAPERQTDAVVPQPQKESESTARSGDGSIYHEATPVQESTEQAQKGKTSPITERSRSSSQSSGSTWEKVSQPDDPSQPAVKQSIYSSSVTGAEEERIRAAKTGEHVDESITSGTYDEVDEHLENSASVVHPHPKDMEEAVKPEAGEAVVAAAGVEETRATYEEMSRITPMECPFLMNRE
ncbi:hypothetical protein LTR66_004115 [Elasticomyces elasticus]|nr:hypothetical protein LTR66_004115 [Elasticomyces elasticus]